jgi:hypothetical protein
MLHFLKSPCRLHDCVPLPLTVYRYLLSCSYYNLAHKYGLGSTYTPSQPSFVANHSDTFLKPAQYLLTKVDDPALGLLVPYGGKIHITSSETGLPCRLHPRVYERSPTGWALSLYCNATDAGEEFTYEVSGLQRASGGPPASGFIWDWLVARPAARDPGASCLRRAPTSPTAASA